MNTSRSRISRASLASLLALGGAFLISDGPAGAAQAPVGLGTATSFAVLGGSTVTNTGPSVISGDLGVSPGSAVTGFPPGTVNDGVIHAGNAEAAKAQADVTTAYNDAAGRSVTANVTADLGGQTLVSGVYRGPTLGLTGTLTLDAQGDPNAVFIFQAGSTLITATASRVSLINGADACNVYWQVGSSATLGTDTDFAGTVLALTAVTAQTGARVRGRLFARNAEVTLDTNTITRGGCAAIAPGTTTATTAAPTTTVAPTGGTTAPTGGTGGSGGTGGTGGSGTGGTGGSGGSGTAGTGTAAAPRSGRTTNRATARTTAGGTGTATSSGRSGTGRGGSSTSTGSDTSLATTGSGLTNATATGLLALMLGAIMVQSSKRTPRPASLHRRRRRRR